MTTLVGCACCLIVCFFVLAGCTGKIRDRKHPGLLTRSDVSHYTTVATTSPSADQRRNAVYRLSKSKRLGEPHVLDTLATVAKTDESSSVRSAALLALDESESPVACEVSLEILERDILQHGRGDKMLRENAGVRAAALKTIRHCADNGRVPPEQLTDAVKLAGQLVESDRSRHVRLEAVRALGCFPQRDALDILIFALTQRDFGICYEAERSLNRLTGESFDCDAKEWQHFVAGVANPFANASGKSETVSASKRKWYDWRLQKSKPPIQHQATHSKKGTPH